MVKISPTQVKRIAALANLALSSDEISAYTEQLSKIVGSVEKLSLQSTSKVEPTFTPIDLDNVNRPDEVRPGLLQEEALKNAPVVKNGNFTAQRTQKHTTQEQK